MHTLTHTHTRTPTQEWLAGTATSDQEYVDQATLWAAIDHTHTSTVTQKGGGGRVQIIGGCGWHAFL